MLRTDQEPPKDPWTLWLMVTGRGFGKTFAASAAILSLLNNLKLVALIGTSFNDVQNVMVDGPSGLINAAKQLKYDYKYKPLQKKLLIKETIFRFFNEDYEKLRGFEFDLIWIDEWMRFKDPRAILYQVYLCLRVGVSKLIITTTPKNIAILKELMEDTNVYVTKGNTYENTNLSKNFFQNIKKLENTNLEMEEIQGQIEEFCLFKSEDIVYSEECEFDYYRIGVDPAVGPGLTGIILLGIKGNQFFVLEDLSTRKDPLFWVPMIINLSKKIKLFIVVESNQGGSMIDSLFKSFGYFEKIYLVYAKHSKIQRIYQCLFFYKNKQVYHNKKLIELEEEMQTTPKDRVDALVWAIIFKIQNPPEFHFI